MNMKDKNKNIYCDIDETLVRSIDLDEVADITFKFKEIIYNKKVNYNLINYLKEKSKKGHYIILWTSNSLGFEWAKAVSKALNIEKYIDDYQFKPI